MAVTAEPRPAVVQVAPFYPPHLGGVEITVQVIASSLAASRPVEVLTTTCGAAGQPRVERSGQLTVRRLRAAEIANTPVAPALAARLLRLPANCVVHVHIAQALTPEIVWITSRIRRRPYIAHFHLDVDPSGPAGRFLMLYKRLLLGPVLRGASSVIVLSAEQERFVTERYRVSAGKVAVVPNGVPLDFAAPSPREHHAAPLRLLFVGRLAPQKNLPDLVEAVRLMNQRAELVIVGDGPELAGITRLIDRFGLGNVTLAGRANRSELGRWYRWADVFVLSSRKEGMPLAVLEAMSAGLPIVATDVPGLHELCAGTGMLVPPDPGEFARALDSLALDPKARERMGELSLAAASSVGWERSLERIERLYLEAAR
jgi:glycosyltransferase involved in cell wall biosynthesis